MEVVMKTTIIHVAVMMARSLLFTMMLFFRPLVVGATSIVAGLCLIGFVGTFVLVSGHAQPLLAFLSLGVVAVAIGFLYNWILMLLAPAGFTMLLEDA
jgi:hypothetical protein